MGEETQAGHTPTPSENINNQTRAGSDRATRGGKTQKLHKKRKKSGIPNTFKGSVTEVGTVIGTKEEN